MSVEISRLANGMRVVSHAMPHLETVSLGVWVGAGARSERPDQHGVAHLLEHMAFKGTGTRSATQIAEEIESVGGDLNAATSLETTAYYARVLKDDLPLAIGLLGDILQNPTFDAIELEREKDVVLQEISAIQDSPDDMIYDLAQELAFPAQALGRPITGTAESVAGFSAGDLHTFRNAHYAGNDMVLSAAGAVDHQELVERAAQEFSALPGQGAHRNDPARYCGGMRHATQKFEQSHLLMAFEGPSYRADEFYAAQVLSTIMGGGMSSRLFQEARERRGLCYAIYSFCWGVSDTGLFGVHAATGPEQVPELLDVIEASLHDAGEAEAANDEISRAKAQLKASLSMSLESSGARADQLARQTLVYGEPLEIADIIAKVDAVTAEGVLSMAERLFGRTPICLSSVGPAARLEKLEEVTAKFGSPHRIRGGIGDQEKASAMALLRSVSAPDPGPLIHGGTIYLRLPQMSDYMAWARIRAVSRGFLTPWEPSWSSNELTRTSYRRRVRHYVREAREDTGYAFFMFRTADDDLLGGLTLSNVRRGVTQACTLGYWIGEPHAQQGHMTAGMRALIPFVFDGLQLHRLEAACLRNNSASSRLLEKCGFQREGIAKRYLRINGIWQDHILYALIDDDPRP